MAPVVDKNAGTTIRVATTKAPANPSTFEGMLAGLREVFNSPDNQVDIDQVYEVLKAYKSDRRDWDRFAFYDPMRYRRNLVDEDANYNVMILGWGANVKSCIHNHSGAHCFMKVLDGEILESRFAWPKEELGAMTEIGRARVAKDDILYINDKVGLHCVANADDTHTATSLHVYIPPFRECKAFDQNTGKAFDCTMKFYSRQGKIVKEDEMC